MALGTRYVATVNEKGDLTRGPSGMGSSNEGDRVDVMREGDKVVGVVAQSSKSQEAADQMATSKYAEVNANGR